MLIGEAVFACVTDTTKPVIKTVEVQHNDPFIGESFYWIFHVDSFVVYKSQYQFDSSSQRLKFDSSGNDISSDIDFIMSEKRNMFFVFHKDSGFGFKYYPHQHFENNTYLPVDSATKMMIGTNSLEGLLQLKPDTITWNDEKTELKEVYMYGGSIDTPKMQLTIYYSSRLNSLKASLNPKLDRGKKMKFYKYEYLFKEFYSEKQKQHWPAMTITSVMKEFTVTNPEEIMQYIGLYKKSLWVRKWTIKIKRISSKF